MSDFKLFFFIAGVILLSACSSKNEKQTNETVPAVTLSIKKEVIDQFPGLIPGEFELKEESFADIKELKGTQINTEALFEVRETQMLVTASLLMMSILNNRNLFIVFSLPVTNKLRQQNFYYSKAIWSLFFLQIT